MYTQAAVRIRRGAERRASLQREAAGFLQSRACQATGLLLHFSYPIWIKQKEGEVDCGLAPWSMDQATPPGQQLA